jgi:hypothetical protein
MKNYFAIFLYWVMLLSFLVILEPNQDLSTQKVVVEKMRGGQVDT